MRIKLTDYRAWVLEIASHHGKIPGWTSFPNAITDTKKGQAAIAKLLKDGALEQDQWGLYRVTEAGLAAYREHQEIAA